MCMAVQAGHGLTADVHCYSLYISHLNSNSEDCWGVSLAVRPWPDCIAVRAGHGLTGAIDVHM